MHGMTERVPLTDLPIEDCVDDVALRSPSEGDVS